MGRTKRKRNKKQSSKLTDRLQAVQLQKSMKLKCPYFKIGYFNDTGRGVMCKRKIFKGDTLIALPLFHLITPKVDCKLFSIIKVESLSPQSVLSIWLVYEDHLKTDSKYFGYIESLPEYYTNLYFCNKEEQKLLPEFIKKQWVAQKINLEDVYTKFFKTLTNRICSHCQTFLQNIFTLNKFVWAWFTVNTRSVYYEDDSNSKSLALAPFLDMFNHSNNAETNMVIDFNSGLYILKTLVEYKKYDQVFIKYGAHSNLKLLVEYGFVIPNNPHDFVEFSFEEVIAALKEVKFNYDIIELKYKFIKDNQLNKNLSKNKEEFSWSLSGLIYVLISEDQDFSLMLSKIYSHNFSPTEYDWIKKIEESVAHKKLMELSDCLLQMELFSNCTESFKAVKSLIKIYIDILK